MALDDEMAILQSTAMFSALADEELRHLAFAAEPIRAGSDRTLFRHGQSIDAAYVLVSGTVTLQDEYGHALSTHNAAGTLFGETGLITRTTWKTSGHIEEPSQFLRLSRPVFRRLLDEYPRAAQCLQVYFAKQIETVVMKLDKAQKRAR